MTPEVVWCSDVMRIATASSRIGRELVTVVIERAQSTTALEIVDAGSDVASLWLTMGCDAPTSPRERLHGLALVATRDRANLIERWRAVSPGCGVAFVSLWDRAGAAATRDVALRTRNALDRLLLLVTCEWYRERAACGPLAGAWDAFEAAGGPAYLRERRALRKRRDAERVARFKAQDDTDHDATE